MDRSHLNQKHMKNQKCKLFARVCSQKVFKCLPFARTHAWRRFLHWSIAVSMMSCWTSDHTTIKRSSISLRTVNEEKSKMLIFCIVLIFALIFMTFGRYVLGQMIKNHTWNMFYVHARCKFLIFKFSKVMQQNT